MSPSPKRWAIVMAVLAAAGCTLSKPGQKSGGPFARVGGKGQLLEPKRCALQVAILSRPLHDPALDAGIWDAADEQVLPAEVRRALEVNGLRIGLITGDLPREVADILNAPPPHKVDPSQIILPDGDHTLIGLGEIRHEASLLLCRDGQAVGKDYSDASGWFRATAQQEGPSGVALRLVPEIHHGPMQQGYSALPTGGMIGPQDFSVRYGQEEETLRELAATLVLQPGQVAVLGCRTAKDNDRSLGAFLFTQPEPNSDRLLQKVTLIWASRSSQGLPPLEAVDPPDMPHSGRPKAGDVADPKKGSGAKDPGTNDPGQGQSR